MKRDEEPPLEYLLDCSKRSLQNILMNHRGKAANCRKDVTSLLNEWVENEAMALLTEWFDKFGEKLIAMAAAPRKRDEEELELPFKLSGRLRPRLIRAPSLPRKSRLA